MFECFLECFNRIENQYNKRIKVFRSDNGTEFIINKFPQLFKEKWIIHQTTCIDTLEQNGVTERENRHLLEVTRSNLFQHNVPKIYWLDALLSANYLIK